MSAGDIAGGFGGVKDMVTRTPCGSSPVLSATFRAGIVICLFTRFPASSYSNFTIGFGSTTEYAIKWQHKMNTEINVFFHVCNLFSSFF